MKNNVTNLNDIYNSNDSDSDSNDSNDSNSDDSDSDFDSDSKSLFTIKNINFVSSILQLIMISILLYFIIKIYYKKY